MCYNSSMKRRTKLSTLDQIQKEMLILSKPIVKRFNEILEARAKRRRMAWAQLEKLKMIEFEKKYIDPATKELLRLGSESPLK